LILLIAIVRKARSARDEQTAQQGNFQDGVTHKGE
jgi:hypothetical protein